MVGSAARAPKMGIVEPSTDSRSDKKAVLFRWRQCKDSRTSTGVPMQSGYEMESACWSQETYKPLLINTIRGVMYSCFILR
jgi:hypothetical protein